MPVLTRSVDTNVDSNETHNTMPGSPHIPPRASLLGESVSAVGISREGRSEEWSVHADVGSRPSSHLTHYTSSSLMVHTSRMGVAASVIGSKSPIAPAVSSSSTVPNLPPSYQANPAIRNGMAEGVRSAPVTGNYSHIGKSQYPPLPPIPALPPDPPPASLFWRTSSIAQSRRTALPSYRESSSPRTDTRVSHEYPPSALLPEYTETSSRQSVIRNTSQATVTDSTPDETMGQSQLPYTPPPQSDTIRLSVQSSSTRLSFHQHPFAMNAPVLFRTESRVSSPQTFPITFQPPNLGLEDCSKSRHQDPVRERSRWTPRMCFMFGFLFPPLWIVGLVNYIIITRTKVNVTPHRCPEDQRTAATTTLGDNERWAWRCLLGFSCFCVLLCLTLVLTLVVK